MSKTLPLTVQASLAPQNLWQDILPWTYNQQGMQFGLFNISIGQTPRPDIEQKVLDEVGSYGRQLGRIGDVLEVLLNHVKLGSLTPAEVDAVEVALLQQLEKGIRNPVERVIQAARPKSRLTRRTSPGA